MSMLPQSTPALFLCPCSCDLFLAVVLSSPTCSLRLLYSSTANRRPSAGRGLARGHEGSRTPAQLDCFVDGGGRAAARADGFVLAVGRQSRTPLSLGRMPKATNNTHLLIYSLRKVRSRRRRRKLIGMPLRGCKCFTKLRSSLEPAATSCNTVAASTPS